MAICWRRCVLLVLFVALGSLAAVGQQRPAKRPSSKASQRLPDLKTPQDKLLFLEMIRSQFPTLRAGRSSSFTSAMLDAELEKSVSQGASVSFAKVVDDATFVRRVYLDVIGRIPAVEEIEAFVADVSPHKRERLIDELLLTDDYARKWARYWRSVVFYESNANRNTVNPQAFEDWLFGEFKNGTPWDRIVAEMVSASPKRDPQKKPQENGWQQDHGPNNFILACERKPEVIAAQTARLFMGISIGCAECHDHPFDRWKRAQFHEMAAFFASGRYYMTDQYDPTQKTEMPARFLLGERPPADLKPDQRRVALAAYLIYNPDNYWFARAFVNRMWNELVGDGFYSVDSLGPDKDVVHQLVVNRLAATFRYSGFDVRWLMRIVLNSRAYQREIRTISDSAELFTAVRPARLRPYEVVANVEQLIGKNAGLSRALSSTFDANPSIPQESLEGTIQQALLMMNNGALLGGLSKSGLRKSLGKIKDNRKLIEQAFLGVLARRPTEAEVARYQQLIKSSNNRGEAIDDLLWILVNSAEFVTKR